MRANLGNLAVEEQRLEDAADLLAEALAYYASHGDERHVAAARLGLAVTYRRMGRAGEALERLRGVPEFYGEADDVGGHALAVICRGEARIALGRRTEAQVPLDEALTIAAEARLPYPTFLARVGLARLYAAAGRHTEATGVARQAIAALGVQIGSLSHERSARVRRERRDAFELGARSARALGDVPSLVHFLESGRAGALLEEMEARDALAKAVLPAPLLAARDEGRRAEAAAWASYRSALSRGRRKEVRRARQAYRDAREALKETIERIQGEVKAAAPVLSPEAASLATLQSALGAGSVLILYARIQEILVAVVIRREGAALVELGAFAEAKAVWRDAAFDDATVDPEACRTPCGRAS